MSQPGRDLALPGDLRERFAREVEPRAALGALLGLAVGDALGTTLEFKELAAPAFPALATGPLVAVVGGGPFRLEAGEVTDDTHMATALAEQLRLSKRDISTEYLVARYLEWSKVAFDVGITIRKALQYAEGGVEGLVAGRRVWEEASGLKPAGNGSLMRTAPIGVLLAPLPAERRQLSMSDSAITHFDPRCQLACAIFNAAIAHAVGRGASARGAYRAARAEIEPALALLLARHPDVEAQARAAAADLAADLDAADQDDPQLYGDPLHIQRTAGFVRVAFRLAFWHLLHAPDFKSAVTDAANRGGDADTNAAIVGALLGAVHRLDSIPADWIAAVLAAPGLASGRADYHPRVFLRALHSFTGAAGDLERARLLAPLVARAFPAERAMADRSLLVGGVVGPRWPIGPGVELTGWRRGGIECGVATGRLEDGEPVLLSVRRAAPGDEQLAARLRLDLPGVPPLVAIGRFTADGHQLAAVVERMPAGEPLSMPGFSLLSGAALARFRQLLEIAARAAELGSALGGIRPELVYHDGAQVTGVAARAQRFLGASPFHALYEAPEIARGGEPTEAADVFSACAVLVFLLRRTSPFERPGADDHPAQAAAIEAGPPPLALPLDDAIVAAVRAGLHPDPALRPGARELLALW